MSLLPTSLPRVKDIQQLYEDPFGFLAKARSSLGDMFVIRETGPIFSRSADCAGAIAVFGAAHHHAVLSDIELFGMPRSAAEHLSLPPHLVNLNRGLHSMRGQQHDAHQRLLMRVFGERSFEVQRPFLNACIETFLDDWGDGQRIGLLSEMRRLALAVSTRLLFGNQYGERSKVASLLHSYFHLRRELTSRSSSMTETSRKELIELGTKLGEALRSHVRWCRRQDITPSEGLLTRLAGLEFEPGVLLAEDELVAHENVLFMSTNEPIAVSLTWILLLLSQLPDVRQALRVELGSRSSSRDAIPTPAKPGQSSLLDCVINESLRLLTPNAFMVRVTTRPASLDGVFLPKGSEIVLCPFLAHRDEQHFPHPNEFLPSRWNTIRPSPFEYFPFGAGGHSCAGRYLAIYLIKTVLGLLMPQYELVLAYDQEVDWQVNIIFMPASDPTMTVRGPAESTSIGGRLLGPVSELVSLDSNKS